jgi:hypothetical protein
MVSRMRERTSPLWVSVTRFVQREKEVGAHPHQPECESGTLQPVEPKKCKMLIRTNLNATVYVTVAACSAGSTRQTAS